MNLSVNEVNVTFVEFMEWLSWLSITHLTLQVLLKDNSGVPLDPPQSSWSFKWLPSAPRSSCHFPSSASPLPPVAIRAEPPPPSPVTTSDFSLTYLSLRLLPVQSIFCSFVPFPPLYDLAIASLCPSLHHSVPSGGSYDPRLPLPPSFCLHAVMI